MRMRTGGHSEDGASLVELGVVMAGIALLGMLMTTWFASVTRTDRLQQREDVAMAQVRDLENLIGRDVRRSSRMTVTEPQRFTVWLDDDRDGVQDSGETVTWSFVEGYLQRSAGDRSFRPASDIRLSGVTFGYDDLAPRLVTSLTVEFRFTVGSAERVVGAGFTLRNHWG